ncbi:hypothetical protein E2C01_054015 [Portunus trituberculatus]|uniref:Uncharacterized protein n=1 Tax=Portunus trituberculatus TaxID=210409 RepID=A0A5B7GM07_PORTR|nr:hypothetical protein [Portunus trituberculatus]
MNEIQDFTKDSFVFVKIEENKEPCMTANMACYNAASCDKELNVYCFLGVLPLWASRGFSVHELLC